MSRKPSKHRTCALAVKTPRNRLRREERVHSKTRHKPGMLWNRWKRSKHIWSELAPVLDEWLHEIDPGISVDAEKRLGIFQIAFENDSLSIVEGVRERSRGVNPLQSTVLQRQGREERRSCGQGIHGGSEIVQEPRQRQFHRAHSAAWRWLGLKHIDLQSGSGQNDRRCQPVGSGPYDTRLARHIRSPTRSRSKPPARPELSMQESPMCKCAGMR